MQFIVTSDYHDTRLDRFVRQTFRDESLATLFRLIRKGQIRVNGRRRKPGYRLQENDTVNVNAAISPSLPRKEVQLNRQQHQQAQECIVYEDERIVVCNKPPNLAMHRGSGHHFGLLEMMQAVLSLPGFTFVHRIDKATSGLVLGAKNRQVAKELSVLFREHEVEKYYMVMVDGLVQEDTFTITSFLKKEEVMVVEHPTDRHGGKKAISEFSVVQRSKISTLLEARLLTGRTHQLRVQLAGYGHPIVGDRKYGGSRAGNMLLCSHRLVIKSWELDVRLPLPDFFACSVS